MAVSVALRSFRPPAARLGVALVCCGACSQGEYGPLGAPSYLPPDSVAGAGASSTTGGNVGSPETGGANGGQIANSGASGAGIAGSIAAMGGAGGLSLGNGGSAGGPAACAAHPIPSKTTWRATASSSGATTPVNNLYDDNLTDRWSTGKPQAGNDWLELDLGIDVTLTQVTLVLGVSTSDYPRNYEVRFSDIAMSMGPAVVTGTGMTGTDTLITFPSALTGRYLRISQTGTATNNYWSVAEIQAQCQG